MTAPTSANREYKMRAGLCVDLGDGWRRVILSYDDKANVESFAVAKLRAGADGIPDGAVELAYSFNEAINLATDILAGDAKALKKPGAARIMASCLIAVAERATTATAALADSKATTA